jgi:hypothetical protein
MVPQSDASVPNPVTDAAPSLPPPKAFEEEGAPDAADDSGTHGDVGAEPQNAEDDGDVEAELRNADFTPAQTAALLRLARNRRGPVADVVKDIFSSFVESGTNYHQVVVYYALSDVEADANMSRPRLCAVSCMIVFFQMLSLIAIYWSIALRTCASNDMCHRGSFCDMGGPPCAETGACTSADASARCRFCGGGSSYDTPVPFQTNETSGQTYNNALDVNYAGFNGTAVHELCAARDPTPMVDQWCTACVHPLTGEVDDNNLNSHARGTVSAMNMLDWFTLTLAGAMIGMASNSELKDIRLCTLAIEKAEKELDRAWKVGFALLFATRRWLFLPGLVYTSAVMVVYQGGDALSICVNTIALLFLLDLDNVVYMFGLDERTRTRVEKAGRVELNEEDARGIDRIKTAHLVIITLGLILGVSELGHLTSVFGSPISRGLGIGQLTGTFVYWFAMATAGAVAEFAPGSTPMEIALVAGRNLGKSLVGWISYLIVLVAAAVLV